MANCTIADVAALVLTPGIRFSPSEFERVQAAIDETAQSVAEDADYATLMAARPAETESESESKREIMPKIGGKKFPYTKSGMKAAKAYSKAKGKPVTASKPKAKRKSK